MLTSELDYALPDALIAQHPASPRDASRLMVVDAKNGSIEHRTFRDLPDYLRPDDALVLNETKVIPARLRARRPTGGAVELLFLRDRGRGWEVLAKPAKRLKPGMELTVGDETLTAVEDAGDGRWLIAGEDVLATLDRYGEMPLPPYIAPTKETESKYQTLYARHPGSAAAPTAGLHFTDEVFGGIERAGAELAKVTLHVGTGTFVPVRTEDLTRHTMHAEFYSVPEDAARTIKGAGRTVAVGTTVARTLESRAVSGLDEGESELFIYPGYEWRAVDAMVTNFHLPRSTLLAMVMSFGGMELIREAYATAVREEYRFFSFGDAMLMLNGGRSR